MYIDSSERHYAHSHLPDSTRTVSTLSDAIMAPKILTNVSATSNIERYIISSWKYCTVPLLHLGLRYASQVKRRTQIATQTRLLDPHNRLPWLLSQISRSRKSRKCLCFRHARRAFHVWESIHLCYDLLYSCICCDADSFEYHHSVYSTFVLACTYGDMLGYIHFRTSWDAEFDSALCVSIYGGVFRE